MAQANRVLPPAVVAVVVVLFAFEAADLTWRLLDTPTVPDVAMSAPTQTEVARADTAAGSLEILQTWAPFGQAPEAAEVGIPASDLLETALTDLNLRLIGVVVAQASPEPGTMVIIQEEGKAILESARGQQKAYVVGDPIEEVSNARLHSVFTDYVILERSAGRLERLPWAESQSMPRRTAGSRTATASAALARQPESLNAAAALADAVGEVAAALGEHIQFAPATDSGRIIGFRVSPRGDGDVFSGIGLEPGDILTQVNGIALDDMRNASGVLRALTETQQANVIIRRNGVDQGLVLDMSDIQRLAESLQ